LAVGIWIELSTVAWVVDNLLRRSLCCGHCRHTRTKAPSSANLDTGVLLGINQQPVERSAPLRGLVFNGHNSCSWCICLRERFTMNSSAEAAEPSSGGRPFTSNQLKGLRIPELSCCAHRAGV
jgi:hypothetical protein